MTQFILRRIARAILTFFIFQTILFFFIYAIPWSEVVTSVPSARVEQASPPDATKIEKIPQVEGIPLEASKPKAKPPVEGLPLEDVLLYNEPAGQDPFSVQAVRATQEPTPMEKTPQIPPEDSSQEVVVEPAEPERDVWRDYFTWMGNFFTGDLGFSTRLRLPVATILVRLAPRTMLLFLPGIVIGFVLGIWLGRLIAWRRGTFLEFGATLGGIAFYTSFAPWLAFFLVSIFAIYLSWLPLRT